MPKARLKFKSGKAKRGAAAAASSSAPAPAFLTQASNIGSKRGRSSAGSSSSSQPDKRRRSSGGAVPSSKSSEATPPSSAAPSLPPSAFVVDKDLPEYPTVDTSSCLPAASDSAGLRFHKLVAGVCSAHAATTRQLHADCPGLVDTVERTLGAMVAAASEAVAEHAQRQANMQANGRLRNPRNDELQSRAQVLRHLVAQYEAEAEALERGAALAGSAEEEKAAADGEGSGDEGMDDEVLAKYALAEQMEDVAAAAAEDVELQADAVRKGLRSVVAVAEDADALAAKGRAALRSDFETLYPGASRPAALIKALAGGAASSSSSSSSSAAAAAEGKGEGEKGGAGSGAASSSSSSAAAAEGGAGEDDDGGAADLARSLVQGGGVGGK